MCSNFVTFRFRTRISLHFRLRDYSGNTLTVGVVAAGISHKAALRCLTTADTPPLVPLLCRQSTSQRVTKPANGCGLEKKSSDSGDNNTPSQAILHLPCAVCYYEDCYVRSIRFAVKGPMKWLWDCNFLSWFEVFLHKTQYWWVGNVAGRTNTAK